MGEIFLARMEHDDDVDDEVVFAITYPMEMIDGIVVHNETQLVAWANKQGYASWCTHNVIGVI
jgi:hypothetical protein